MDNTKYGVVCQSLEQLFSVGSSRYTIPTFQRTYSWRVSEVAQLIDDVFSAEDLNAPYFIGSIVLARKSTTHGEKVSDEIVLDGQQRLTTLSLLISVLIHKAAGMPTDNDVSDFKAYLFTRRLPNERGTKLLLQAGDRDVYEALLNGRSEGVDKKSLLYKASLEIEKMIGEFAQKPPFSKDSNPYIEMLNRAFYNVEIVKITAPSEREAFRLFETLNDRGLDLSAADLIKNKILSNCPEKDMQDAINAWSNIVEYAGDDVVGFLRSYWIAFKEFVRVDELYDKFKDAVDEMKSKDIPSFVVELEECAKLYSLISTPESISTSDSIFASKELLIRLNALRAKSCRPLLLLCAKKAALDFNGIVKLCASVTIRYSVISEKNPSKLEKLYSKISSAVRNQGGVAALNQIDFSEIPVDSEIVAKLNSISIDPVNASWREILCAINEHESNDGEILIKTPKLANIEHILPKSPSGESLKESGLSSERASELCHRLGNLTFLNSRKNRQISNKAYSVKCVEFKDSSVSITSSIPLRWNVWNEDSINDRTTYLANQLVTIFKHPKS